MILLQSSVMILYRDLLNFSMRHNILCCQKKRFMIGTHVIFGLEKYLFAPSVLH